MTNMPKIYTKTGDKGKSSLYTGERVHKTDVIFDCLGTIDTCNAFIGLSMEYNDDDKISKDLELIMHDLMNIGSHVATRGDRIKFDSKHISYMENEIDRMVEQLPPLKNFIICGGGKFSSHLHVARTFVRSLERMLLKLEGLDVNVHKYVNRLSDYFFTLARYHSIVIKGNDGDVLH